MHISGSTQFAFTSAAGNAGCAVRVYAESNRWWRGYWWRGTPPAVPFCLRVGTGILI